MQFDPETRVVAIPDQVSCDVAGETAVLSLRSGVYYSLNEVGSRIWTLIQQPISVAEVAAAILEEFDVERSVCESDLRVLLTDLASHGLLEVV